MSETRPALRDVEGAIRDAVSPEGYRSDERANQAAEEAIALLHRFLGLFTREDVDDERQAYHDATALAEHRMKHGEVEPIIRRLDQLIEWAREDASRLRGPLQDLWRDVMELRTDVPLGPEDIESLRAIASWDSDAPKHLERLPDIIRRLESVVSRRSDREQPREHSS